MGVTLLSREAHWRLGVLRRWVGHVDNSALHINFRFPGGKQVFSVNHIVYWMSRHSEPLLSVNYSLETRQETNSLTLAEGLPGEWVFES